ncbi:hypothetical protein ACFL96_12805 [Thermoproteota archaeon]
MTEELDKLLETCSDMNGVDHDYWNEYAGLWLNYQLGGIKAVAKTVRQSPIRRYWDRCAPNRMVGAERGLASTLNTIADYVNANFTDPACFGKRELEEVFDETHKLVYAMPFPHRLC